MYVDALYSCNLDMWGRNTFLVELLTNNFNVIYNLFKLVLLIIPFGSDSNF